MRNPEKGAVRPLWLAVGVMTCVIFGTTLNKCLTCGVSANAEASEAPVVPVSLGDPLYTPKAPEPEPVAAKDPAVVATPAEDAVAAVTPGPKPADGPVPGPPAETEDESDEAAADYPPIEPREKLRPLPKDPEPLPKDLRDYLDLNFDKLSSYTYELPEPGTEQKKDQIPESVRKLDTKKVAMKGFMVPLKTEGEDVIQFVLVRNQMACCFGIVPRINEWIHVRMAPGKAAPYALDIPITIFGKLEVGEVYENGYIMSVYRMECDKVIEPPVYR